MSFFVPFLSKYEGFLML